jgi:hypothetical protein
MTGRNTDVHDIWPTSFLNLLYEARGQVKIMKDRFQIPIPLLTLKAY